MKFDISGSHNYEKEFFGRAYPWYRGFLLSITGISLIGSLSAFYTGITDRVDVIALGLIALTTILISICLRLLYLGFTKFWSLKWNKIVDIFKDIVFGLFAICVLLLFCYMMFHDCSAQSHGDLDHIHYEGYHP